MTTNKPEVVAYLRTDKESPELRGVSLHHDESCINILSITEPLVRLSDYEALQAELETVKKVAYGNIELLEENKTLQAEYEKLRKDAERYRYIKRGRNWIAEATQTGVQLDGEDLDNLIDSGMEQDIKCPYCKAEASKVGGDVVYPHRPDLSHRWFYYCDNGHEPAYVGCHKDGKPFGTLADSRTRKARSQAHAAFDPLWKDGLVTRKQAYALLAQHMGLPAALTHIGMFDESQAQIAEEFGIDEYLKRG